MSYDEQGWRGWESEIMVRLIEGMRTKIVLDEIGSLGDPEQPLFGAMAVAFASDQHVKAVLAKAAEREILDQAKTPKGDRANRIFDELTRLLCGDGTDPGGIPQIDPGCVPQIVYVRKDDAGVREWIREYPMLLKWRGALEKAPPASNLLWVHLVIYALMFLLSRIAMKGERIIGADFIYHQKCLDTTTYKMLHSGLHRFSRPEWVGGVIEDVRKRHPAKAAAMVNNYQVDNVTVREGDDRAEKELQIPHLLGRILVGSDDHIDFLTKAWGLATVREVTDMYPGASLESALV